MKIVKINSTDNVAVALESVSAGERLSVDGAEVCAVEDIPAGHKIAIRAIGGGESVMKYGSPIGSAARDIAEGEHVHVHNLVSALSGDGALLSLEDAAPLSSSAEVCGVNGVSAFFNGYRRSDGSAGIRNEIFIIPTVGCVNNVCRELERRASALVGGGLDGVYALTHQFGCSQLGEDAMNIKRLICSLAVHPNAAFVLIVGLGCENNRLEDIREALEPSARGNIFYLSSRQCSDEIEAGMEILRPLAKRASEMKREPLPVSLLRVGLKCGGSDGFSGITANPTVGRAADILVSLGGSAVLTEVPEMFGAESSLACKCADAEVLKKFKKLIYGYRDFYLSNGFPIYENPSPGNREGGITTLEEKSLGCVEKAGTSPVRDCIGYGEIARKSGITVLDAPGNDLISSTALAAAGCHAVLFTTGRGTPFATCVPTVKIASNGVLALEKSGWIDFDASNFNAETGKRLYEKLITVCSGGECRTEKMREIAFFKKGVTL